MSQASGRRHLHLLGEVALWAGATLGLLCLLAGLAAVLFGVKPLVFQSGSMSPTIPAGSLAFAHTVPADQITPGDVVSVRNADGIRVTHRVVEIRPSGTEQGPYALTLKGDANAAADATPYLADRVDLVRGHVPLLGYVAAWASGPLGMLLAGMIVAGVLLGLVSTMRRPPAQPRTGRRARRMVSGVGVGVIAVLAAGALSPNEHLEGTAAAFTDSASVETGAFAGATLAPPPAVNCVADGGLLSRHVDLSWTPVLTTTRARMTLSSGATTTVVTPDVPAGTNTIRLTAAGVAGLLNVDGTLNVRLYATAGDHWISSGFAYRTIKRTSVLGLGLDIRC